jgi:DNA-binding response OmpR family regulator
MNRILIVDDEPAILMSLDFLMKKEGFEVYIARDGEEALTIIKKEKPDLIILDIMMPNVDGYEVCEFVKKSAQFNHIKVIFLSAKTRSADIEKGYQLGADDYVVKPFSTKELVVRVKDLLKKKTRSIHARK